MKAVIAMMITMMIARTIHAEEAATVTSPTIRVKADGSGIPRVIPKPRAAAGRAAGVHLHAGAAIRITMMIVPTAVEALPVHAQEAVTARIIPTITVRADGSGIPKAIPKPRAAAGRAEADHLHAGAAIRITMMIVPTAAEALTVHAQEAATARTIPTITVRADGSAIPKAMLRLPDAAGKGVVKFTPDISGDHVDPLKFFNNLYF